MDTIDGEGHGRGGDDVLARGCLFDVLDAAAPNGLEIGVVGAERAVSDADEDEAAGCGEQAAWVIAEVFAD